MAQGPRGSGCVPILLHPKVEVMAKRNKPATKAELKKLKKGTYAHKHPNRRVRRHFLRHPPKPVKPVDAGDKLPVSGGHDPGASGQVAGRESTPVGKQTPVALSAVYGFFSRVGHLLDFRRWRVWVVAVGSVRRLFGGA